MEKIKIPLGQIQTNCYIIHNEKEIIIFDPGDEPEKIIQAIEPLGKQVIGVILTHTHFDHIGAVDAICSHYDVPVYVSNEEQYWLTDPIKNGSEKFKQYGLAPVIATTKPKLITPGKQRVNTFHFDVVQTPGHSPGSLSFIFNDFAIVGDTLFKESIGRTDLYEGNTQQLLNSITNVLLSLPEQLTICPGHGPNTTVQYEKKYNPFLK
ncbi:MBL fold metallo-hydrolase [Macrococcoides caseolyticum]|uniref:MBL fold metallo-hydrolase n=1 Tax=Macrococcoides caseolyticum TaxID=69966 RepID=UPI001F1CD8CC|nr:MBL fold metallo-hydrolase [Macrococcus caseolyticus]MCE4956112.1 MBL fold metallo-hydrolase [Macrococcus caseolyticus]